MSDSADIAYALLTLHPVNTRPHHPQWISCITTILTRRYYYYYYYYYYLVSRQSRLNLPFHSRHPIHPCHIGSRTKHHRRQLYAATSQSLAVVSSRTTQAFQMMIMILISCIQKNFVNFIMLLTQAQATACLLCPQKNNPRVGLTLGQSRTRARGRPRSYTKRPQRALEEGR